MKKLLYIFFIILFIPACPYLEEPMNIYPPSDSCSKYGCGEGGVCKEMYDNGAKSCECQLNYNEYDFENFNEYYSEELGEYFKSYCMSNNKQLILNNYYEELARSPYPYEDSNHKFLLSNYGYDIPREVDSYNRFLYYSDSVRIYDGFYLVEDYHTIKLLDHYYEVEAEIYFDKTIKAITHNDDENIYKNIILFEDNSIEVYDKMFSIKLLEFTSGEEIKKISSNSYINQNNEFIYYNIINDELKIEYIEDLSPALDIENYGDKSCSLMEKSKITCMKKLSNNDNTINKPFIIENDENILFFKENCIYTDKDKLYCLFNDPSTGKIIRRSKEVYIKTINKDHFGSTDIEFCYLKESWYSCVKYEDMEE